MRREQNRLIMMEDEDGSRTLSNEHNSSQSICANGRISATLWLGSLGPQEGNGEIALNGAYTRMIIEW